MVTHKTPSKVGKRLSQVALLVPPGFEAEAFYKLAKPVQTMLKRMSSARQRSQQSLTSYCIVASNFFKIIGGVREPTKDDWDGYFMVRRKLGISERTLQKDFNILKKLAGSNDWPWPYHKEDAPRSYEETDEPAYTREEVGQFIKAWPHLSRTERFYLACSTIWGLRSIELARIVKRDFDGQVIKIWKSKREKPILRLIPDELKPLFSAVHPTIDNKASLSYMFTRICAKAGIKREKGKTWHAIRYCLSDELEYACTVNRVPKSYLGAWMGWADARIGREAGGAAMAGTYIRHNRVSDEAFKIDKTILPIHPFLKFWQGVKP